MHGEFRVGAWVPESLAAWQLHAGPKPSGRGWQWMEFERMQQCTQSAAWQRGCISGWRV